MPPDQTPPTDRIPANLWVRTPKLVRAEMVAMAQELAAVKKRLEKVEEQLRRNSQNSSQPPSQDRPEHKPVREDTAPSKVHRGEQRGHAGHHRALLPLAEMDQIVVHRPVQCAQCGVLLLGDDGAPYRYQVTELPRLQAYVTEHQVHTVICPCCGTKNRGQLPTDAAASQFGPNLTSLMALLMGSYRLSKRQVADLLLNCFTVRLAASSVVNQQRVISQALAQPVEELHRYVQQQPACNVDETGWRQADQTKHCWLWVVVTTVVTVFHIASSRSGAVACQLLGEDYDGIVGSDGASAYNWLDPSQRQVCWSHLLRDFQKN